MGKQIRKDIIKKHKGDLCTHRHVFYLNSEDHNKLMHIFSTLGRKSVSKFIASIVIGKPIKVIKIDKAALDYYIRLTHFYNQFQAIGTNYNQLVKALKTNFSDKRAIALLFQLEKDTTNLSKTCREVIELTHKYEREWLQK